MKPTVDGLASDSVNGILVDDGDVDNEAVLYVGWSSFVVALTKNF